MTYLHNTRKRSTGNQLMKVNSNPTVLNTYNLILVIEFKLLEQSLVIHDGESPWQYHRWLMARGEISR